MLMKSVGERIKELRDKNGLSQEELAALTSEISHRGISRQSISYWESGKSTPRSDNLSAVATALGVDVATLLDGTDTKNAPFPKEERGEIMNPRTSTQKETFSAEPNISEQRLNIKNVIWIPVISPILRCSAGDGNNYENSDVAWDIVSKYPLFDGPLSALYNDECLSGMYAEGDSMEPQIHDGDLVVFVHDNTWIPGNIAIVRLDGKLFVKGILRGKSGYILRSQNKNYADIEVHESDDFSIVGRVVKIITDRNPKPIL